LPSARLADLSNPDPATDVSSDPTRNLGEVKKEPNRDEPWISRGSMFAINDDFDFFSLYNCLDWTALTKKIGSFS
jgi:hypothetical protein